MEANELLNIQYEMIDAEIVILEITKTLVKATPKFKKYYYLYFIMAIWNDTTIKILLPMSHEFKQFDHLPIKVNLIKVTIDGVSRYKWNKTNT